MKRARQMSIPIIDYLCDDDRRALAYPWALPLLESLLRREVVEADSCEMSDWYIDLLEEIEQEYCVTFPAPGGSGTPGEAERTALRVLALLRKGYETIEH